MRIPKIIHHVWVGRNPLPEFASKYIDSWKRHHPDWEFRLWTDENLPRIQNHAVYQCTGTPAQKADILRYELLNQFGGVYVDTDFECLRNIEPLIGGCGFFYADELPATPSIGILGSVPLHTFARRLLNQLAERWPYQGGHNTNGETGPGFFCRAVLSLRRSLKLRPFSDPRTNRYCGNYLDIGEGDTLLAFEPPLFYPYYLGEAWIPENHPDAYAVHHWKHGWGGFTLQQSRRHTDDTEWVIPEIVDQNMYRAAELARALLDTDGVIVDCGAHIGAFSCWLAHHGVSQPIKAFEPQCENFALLEANAGPYCNIEAIQAAVSTSNGERELHRGDGTGRWYLDGSGSDGDSQTVNTINIYEYLHRFTRIALLKLDLEGHEAEILNNMPEELLRKIDILIVEIHEHAVDLERLKASGLETWFHPFDKARHIVLRRGIPFSPSFCRNDRKRDERRPRVLVIADTEVLARRMPQGEYLRYQALMNRNNVTVVGTANETFTRGLPIQDLFAKYGEPDFILHGMDMGASGIPLVKGLEIVNIPKAIDLVDVWSSPHVQQEFINKYHFDYGFMAGKPFSSDYASRCPNCQFIWVPWAVDVSQFRNRRVEKDIDILLYGAVDHHYPHRQRIRALLSRKDVQDEFRVRIIPHPGYHDGGYTPQSGHFVGESLAKLISRSWIGIATSSRYDALFMKHFEIAAAGALVVGTVPCPALPFFDNEFVSLKEMSDEEILLTFRGLLSDKRELLERINRSSSAITARFSTTAYADNVLDLIDRIHVPLRRTGVVVRDSGCLFENCS